MQYWTSRIDISKSVRHDYKAHSAVTMPEPTHPPAATNPRRFRWRRLVQYRLRTLLILTTIVAVTFAWWSYSARRQRLVVEEIRRHTGRVWYSDEKGGSPSSYSHVSYWPKWLVDALGKDYFYSPRAVHFKRLTIGTSVFSDGHFELPNSPVINPDVQDDLLACLRYLPGLVAVDLSYTSITDTGLEHLKELTALKELDLAGTLVSDTAVERLQKRLPNCKIRH